MIEVVAPPEVDVYLGRMITPDRRVRFFSATSVEMFDKSQGGCPRKAYYRYVEGKRPPDAVSKDTGKRVHREIRSYLLTGVDTLGPIARLSKHLLPEPGPDLIVEQSIVEVGNERPEPTITGLVNLEGKPLVGAPDLAHGRCTNRGGSDIEDTRDPPGTMEVIDHKTTGRIEYAKGPEELRRNFQILGYGEHFRLKYKPRWLRLSHHYMRTDVKSAPAFKRTIRISAQEVADRFGSFQTVGRRMVDMALATSADDVDANPMACSAYGGCPHREYCTAHKHDSLARSFGERAAAVMLAAQPKKEDPIMSLLEGLGSTVAPPPATTPPVVPALPVVPPELIAAFDVISRGAMPPHNVGWPAVTGEASVLKASWEGVLVSPADRYEGSGIFSPAALAAQGKVSPMVAIHDPAVLVALAGDLINKRGVAPYQPPAPVAPPVQMTVNPPVQVTASLPLTFPGDPPAPPVVTAPAAAVVTAPSTLTPSDQPPIQTSTQIAATADAAKAEKKKRGRPPKKAAEGTTMVVGQSPVDGAFDDVAIFVNAIPSCPAVDLWPRVNALAAMLAAGDGSPTGQPVVDIRAASGDHKLAFGRWKGALGALVREMVEHQLDPGAYMFITGSDEIGAVAADAMRGADMLVWGVR